MSTASSASATAHVRSLYRRLLRELPTPNPQSTNAATTLRSSIRSHFTAPSSTSTSTSIEDSAFARRQEVDQAIQYLKAQRIYLALLQRYNPGMDMDEEERVRLTARRVGMDMPEEWYGKGKPGKFGVEFEGGKKRE